MAETAIKEKIKGRLHSISFVSARVKSCPFFRRPE